VDQDSWRLKGIKMCTSHRLEGTSNSAYSPSDRSLVKKLVLALAHYASESRIVAASGRSASSLPGSERGPIGCVRCSSGACDAENMVGLRDMKDTVALMEVAMVAHGTLDQVIVTS
jgi:hypothetical protein